MTVLHTLWQRIGPVAARPAWRDLARVAIGAGLGLAFAGLLVWESNHFIPGLLFLFAPLGATAVLVFAVPSSPLAQPWNCVVGNTISAVWTLLLFWAFPQLPLPAAAALAVSGAIAIMLACRALHPPGGAVALLMVLSASTLLPMGWQLLIPMSLMTASLVVAGVIFHRATGRTYLHAAPAAAKNASTSTATRSAQSSAGRLALSHEDLQTLLARFDQSNNLDPEALGDLLAAAEEEAIKRRFSSVQCSQVMSGKLLTITPATPLEEVASLFHKHLVKSLPVVDAQGQLIGRVLRADLFDWLWEGHQQALHKNLWQRIKRGSRTRQQHTQAKDLMRAPEMCVQETTPLGDLLQDLASHTVQFIAVLRGPVLVGVITRSDVIRTLLSLK